MNREELIADLDWLKKMAIESRANGVIEGIDALKRKALRAQADSASTPAQASKGARKALEQIANARMIDIRGAQEIARAAISSTPTDALPIVTRTHDVS